MNWNSVSTAAFRYVAWGGLPLSLRLVACLDCFLSAYRLFDKGFLCTYFFGSVAEIVHVGLLSRACYVILLKKIVTDANPK